MHKLTFDLHKALKELVDELSETIQIESFYIHGSLVTDSFDILKSDIDYVVVVDELTDDIYDALSDLHKRLLRHSMLYFRFEGSYISKSMQRQLHKPVQKRLYYNHGVLVWEAYGDEWYFERALLNHKGQLIKGKPLYCHQDVTPNLLKLAALGMLNETWIPFLQDKHLTEAYLVYGLETLPRLIALLKEGYNLNKVEARKWYISTFGRLNQDERQLREMIRQAREMGAE